MLGPCWQAPGLAPDPKPRMVVTLRLPTPGVAGPSAAPAIVSSGNTSRRERPGNRRATPVASGPVRHPRERRPRCPPLPPLLLDAWIMVLNEDRPGEVLCIFHRKEKEIFVQIAGNSFLLLRTASPRLGFTDWVCSLEKARALAAATRRRLATRGQERPSHAPPAGGRDRGQGAVATAPAGHRPGPRPSGPGNTRSRLSQAWPSSLKGQPQDPRLRRGKEPHLAWGL